MHIGTFCRRMCPIYRYFACLIIATYRSLVNRRNIFLSAGHRISQLFRPFPHRNLDFCQPAAFLLLIPDSINLAFPNGSCDFIPVFFDVFQNGFIGLRQGAVGAPVKHAGRLNFRQGLKYSPPISPFAPVTASQISTRISSSLYPGSR